MNDITIDPNKLTVEEKKLMGMWPDPNLIGSAIAPYIKRMQGEVDVLDIGVGKGENIYYLNEHVTNITKIYGLSHDEKYEDILQKNMHKLTKVSRSYENQQVSVVIVNMNESTTDEQLKLYYDKVKQNGYFVGDMHDKDFTKDVLTKFRRNEKIGNPIQIVNKTIWFWKKS